MPEMAHPKRRRAAKRGWSEAIPTNGFEERLLYGDCVAVDALPNQADVYHLSKRSRDRRHRAETCLADRPDLDTQALPCICLLTNVRVPLRSICKMKHSRRV
ncbi:hypothetical protein A7C99_6094 [Trichophyton rubrum]|uniref:Uncharacterized protein n=1 Tax=Trichophyton rubrum TaxID=5551 RepID=A0A178EVE2_TRIRU|nr:hypothetical protein A7C99_6094 [Trichophyton rubrum]